jgi:hypothetical protein
MTLRFELTLENVEQELATQASWTSGLVDLTRGDIWIDGASFGTYFLVIYPNAPQPAMLLINALDAHNRPVLSRAFDFDPSRTTPLLSLPASQNPWSEDGVLIGPILNPEEIGSYGIAERIEQVAWQILSMRDYLIKPSAFIACSTAGRAAMRSR